MGLSGVPAMSASKYTVDFGGLGRLLRCMDARPIRRHCCDGGREVCEGHLCTVESDHALHGGTSGDRKGNALEAVFVCEACIVEHDLTVAVLCGSPVIGSTSGYLSGSTGVAETTGS